MTTAFASSPAADVVVVPGNGAAQNPPAKIDWEQAITQLLAEKLTEASADSFAGPMFELFTLQRS